MAKKEQPIEGEIIVEKSCCGNCGSVNGGSLFLGTIFLVLGGLVFLNNFYPNFEIGKYFWPIILILIGFSMLKKSFRG